MVQLNFASTVAPLHPSWTELAKWEQIDAGTWTPLRLGFRILWKMGSVLLLSATLGWSDEPTIIAARSALIRQWPLTIQHS